MLWPLWEIGWQLPGLGAVVGIPEGRSGSRCGVHMGMMRSRQSKEVLGGRCE